MGGLQTGRMPGKRQVAGPDPGNRPNLFHFDGIQEGGSELYFFIQLNRFFIVCLTMCMNGEVGSVIGLVETGSFGTITGGRIKADERVRQCAFQETKLFCILGECK
jgi:hypothetical protein